MKAYCPVLRNGKYLPTKYAIDTVQGGQNVSPPVSWGEIPGNTKAFALTLIESGKPSGSNLHWIVANMGVAARDLAEGVSGLRDRLPKGSLELRNSFGKLGYTGPFASPSGGPREYNLTVYALTDTMDVGPFSGYADFAEQLKKRVAGQASTILTLLV